MSELKQTDLSKRLRQLAGLRCIAEDHAKIMCSAAYEIERYYTGMLNWKATAEAQSAKPEATKPAQDLGAAKDAELFDLARACFGVDLPFDALKRFSAALASSANALSAEDRVDAVKCWKDRMASPQNREWRGAMEEAMEAEIMELRMVLSSNKVDAERYRYIRDTATLDNAVWEALEGYGMTNGAGELLEDEYRAGMDRAIDRAIQAQKDGHG